eukprot:COSAG01_NODE_7_length_54400_cov_1218.054935_39_plen_293_part_00
MIPSEIIKKIKGLDFKTRFLVQNIFSGNYHSRFKGQGMEFAELREYQAGDDIRQIDWKNTEKMNSPYIKIFEEERELTVILAIDLSASGLFGSAEQSKQELILEIAAVLGFSAAKNKDKVGLLLFSDQVEHYLPPKKGKNSIMRILRDIYCIKAKRKKTSIQTAANALIKNLKKKSVVFLISDFIDENYENSLKLLSKRHDLIPIVIKDPWESKLPNVKSLLLQDPESDDTLDLNINDHNRSQYQNICTSDKLALKRAFKQSNSAGIHLNTQENYILALKQYFKQQKTQKHV